MEITHLSPRFAVTAQLRPEELAAIAAQGFRAVVNNRPDVEAPGQPTSNEIELEARRLGLSYAHIPIAPGQMTDRDAGALSDFLAGIDGPAIAFCRTGARSTKLWELSRQLLRDPD